MVRTLTQIIDPPSVFAYCDTVARAIPTAQMPERHAFNVSRLLFMTAAHESDGFRTRRQYGFSHDSSRGAFGLWQVQWNSISQTLGNLFYRPDIFEQAQEFLNKYNLPETLLFRSQKKDILWILQEPEGDPLCVLFARLHYKWIPEFVPDNIYDMAAYAKQYYNTDAGKARASDYRLAFEKYWPFESCDRVTPLSPSIKPEALASGKI